MEDKKIPAGTGFTEEEEKVLDYLVSSGTYGNYTNLFNNQMSKFEDRKTRRLSYVLNRIFIPLERVKTIFPLFYKVPILLPFLPIYRLVKGLRIHKNKVKEELSLLLHYKKEE